MREVRLDDLIFPSDFKLYDLNVNNSPDYRTLLAFEICRIKLSVASKEHLLFCHQIKELILGYHIVMSCFIMCISKRKIPPTYTLI